MEKPEINHLDWTTAFLILALILIALPFFLPVALAMR